uniref:Uncharacterized protein n=1 Tax=Oryza barthii TaxID=65489 RepID=A0A0D3HAL4_9ORYZ
MILETAPPSASPICPTRRQGRRLAAHSVIVASILGQESRRRRCPPRRSVPHRHRSPLPARPPPIPPPEALLSSGRRRFLPRRAAPRHHRSLLPGRCRRLPHRAAPRSNWAPLCAGNPGGQPLHRHLPRRLVSTAGKKLQNPTFNLIKDLVCSELQIRCLISSWHPSCRRNCSNQTQVKLFEGSIAVPISFQLHW